MEPFTQLRMDDIFHCKTALITRVPRYLSDNCVTVSTDHLELVREWGKERGKNTLEKKKEVAGRKKGKIAVSLAGTPGAVVPAEEQRERPPVEISRWPPPKSSASLRSRDLARGYGVPLDAGPYTVKGQF